MKKLTLLFILAILLIQAQAQQLMWQNHYGDEFNQFSTSWEENSDIMSSEPGTYIWAATSYKLISGSDQYIIKVNDLGELMWHLRVGTSNFTDQTNSSIKTIDGNYLAVGHSFDTRLTKFTEAGDTLFSKLTSCDLLSQTPSDVFISQDNKYVVASTSYPGLCVTKYNEDAETIWCSNPMPDTIGSGVFSCYQPHPDVPAYYGVSRHGYKYYWFKTDTLAQLLQLKELRFPEYPWLDGLRKARMLSNGNIMVHGTASFDGIPSGSPYCPDNPNSEFGFLHEYDTVGNIVKERYFCQSLFWPVTYEFREVIEASDGSFYLLYWNKLKKLDADWNDVWEFELDLSDSVELSELAQFEYGYLIAAGQQLVGYDNLDLFMCKIALPEANGITEQIDYNDFSLYPNPATSTLNIQTDNPSPINDYHLQIHNAQGQLVTLSVVEGPQTTLNIEHLSPGIYFLTLDNGEQTLSRKFVKQ